MCRFRWFFLNFWNIFLGYSFTYYLCSIAFFFFSSDSDNINIIPILPVFFFHPFYFFMSFSFSWSFSCLSSMPLLHFYLTRFCLQHLILFISEIILSFLPFLSWVQATLFLFLPVFSPYLFPFLIQGSFIIHKCLCIFTFLSISIFIYIECFFLGVCSLLIMVIMFLRLSNFCFYIFYNI